MSGATESAGRPHVLISTMGSAQNIGDVGHSPSILRAFERWAPQARLTLWPLRPFDANESAMVRRHHPEVTVVTGGLDAAGRPDTPAVRRAFESAAMFVHGSGPSFHRADQTAAWARHTGRPYGVFGITTDPLRPVATTRLASGAPSPDGGTLDELAAGIDRLPTGHLDSRLRRLLDGAAFVYCRDPLSLSYLIGQDVRPSILGFGPDSTFALEDRDDTTAARFLRAHGLAEQRFVCAIPRLRYTPYHTMAGKAPSDEERRRDQVNAATVEHDLDLLRRTVVAVVRETGLKALVCPEMSYQMPVAKESVVDRLPRDVRDQVVWRPDFWLPDEAAAVYERARAVISMECHSPIMATQAGTPAIYLRQPTDTVKGSMWSELGLGHRLFEIDHTRPDDLVDGAVTIAGHGHDEARADAARTRARAERQLADMVHTVLAAAV